MGKASKRWFNNIIGGKPSSLGIEEVVEKISQKIMLYKKKPA
ncbi:MAG: hypothetical protein WBL93_02695 [Lutisporaceae bacterium]